CRQRSETADAARRNGRALPGDRVRARRRRSAGRPSRLRSVAAALMPPLPLLDVFLSPLGFGLSIALIAWLGRRPLPRALLLAGLASEGVCLLLTTPAGANVLLALQERRAPLPTSCAAPEPRAIVLLSGGIRRDAIDAGDYGVLNVSSLQRTLAAAAL